MTKDDILSMAQKVESEVGFVWCANLIELERFAALVAEKEREAIHDEWHSCVMSDHENGVKCL